MIESVISQSYTNWELLIVDDCSTDDSVKVIKTYVKKDNWIKLIKLDVNSGPAVSCNTAIDLASGRYIAFLDSDDLWLSSKLHKQIKFIEENSFPFVPMIGLTGRADIKQTSIHRVDFYITLC